MPDRQDHTRELTAVLESYLGDAVLLPRGAAWPGSRLRALLSPASATQPPPGEAEARALLQLVGITGADLDRLVDEVGRMTDPGGGGGLAPEALPTLVQAYSRAVGRVVAAESRTVRDALAGAEPAQRPKLLDGALRALLPLVAHGFEALHRAMLFEALTEVIADTELDPTASTTVIVGMVDLVGSTAYLGRTTATTELERLLDALFEASQRATAGRETHVVKHVGDGVFLAGHDAADVAAVALDVLERLESALPLRARGGLAHGTVLERAGDIFGLPVNRAQIVSKAAQPGRVLAEEAVARLLPTTVRGRLRTVDVPHAALGQMRVATLRRPPVVTTVTHV